MHTGGGQLNQRTAQIIRFSSLVIPVVLTLDGLLIRAGIGDTGHYVSDQVFFAIMIPWIALGGFQLLYVFRRHADSGWWLIVYHLFAAAYILLISGFDTLLVGSWILLFFASFSYFSKSGIQLSVMSLVTVAGADILLHVDNNRILLTDIVSLIAIIFIGIVAAAIGRSQEVDTSELSRSKAEESLQHDRILTIINNLADAVLSTDSLGVINVYNAASLNLLDTNSTLNGKKIDEVMTLYDSDKKPLSLFETIKKSRGTTIRDDLNMTIDEELLHIEATFSPIRSSFRQSKRGEKEDGYIIILRDITKAKSLEEERDEFISVVSHELRTPITITEGTISNVQFMMERSIVSKKTLKSSIDTAHEQVIFLAKMINDLSTLSRAERGVADEAESIDVRELVHSLYTEYAPEAKKKKLHFDLDAGTRLGTVMASRLYLHELLQNFITNSIKYTKEGGVTLLVDRHDNLVRFEVRDTGIGISKSDQDKIFNKFYRSEDYRTRETGGTGLGLYVAVKLAKKLHTKIDLSSRLNHGSSFSFELPVEK